MNLKGKKVLVIGSGISGCSAVRLLAESGANPILFDSNGKLDVNELEEKLQDVSSTEIYVGTLPDDVKEHIDLVVPSPGVPCDCGLVSEMKKRNIPVAGEIELAFSMEKGMLVAITGTNGKTTTTSLVGEIMKRQFPDTFIVGNIGNPYTTEVLKTSEKSVTVGEISSFQLESVDSFHPHVSAILNITPDHLNRHHTMENYCKIKGMISARQTKRDFCILNYDNIYTREFGEKICRANVVWFSSSEELKNGYFLKDDCIMYAADGNCTKILNVNSDMNLVGICNIENVMAAIGIARSAGVPMNIILDAVKNFHAVEHRIEFVTEKKGVRYYNDSKGTNPDAAIQGIRAMDRPTLLIGGGFDKESEYDDWIESFDGKVKLLVLIGQTREKIAACAKKHGFCNYIFADTLEEAIDECVKQSREGDAVLLSPACASWGMFPNYEVRGKVFKEYVLNLEE